MKWLQRITQSHSKAEAIGVLVGGFLLVGLLGVVITAIFIPIF
jgi:hypothetical protein